MLNWAVAMTFEANPGLLKDSGAASRRARLETARDRAGLAGCDNPAGRSVLSFNCCLLTPQRRVNSLTPACPSVRSRPGALDAAGGTTKERQAHLVPLVGAGDRDHPGLPQNRPRALSLHDDGCIAGQRSVAPRRIKCPRGQDDRQRGFITVRRTNRPLHNSHDLRRRPPPVWPVGRRPSSVARILTHVAAISRRARIYKAHPY